MTTRPKRKRKSPVSTGEGTGETATPLEAVEPSAAAPAEPAPFETPEAAAVAPDSAPPAAESAEPVPPAQALVPVARHESEAEGETIASEELQQDEAVVDRVEHLAKDVALLLVAAGVVGIIMPGVLGTPFLIAGAAALWPGNRQRLQRWREGHSPKFFHGGMKQINRFLDDLERRYPKSGRR